MKLNASFLSFALLSACLAANAAPGPHGGLKRRLAITDLVVSVAQQAAAPPAWDPQVDATYCPPPIPSDLGAGVTEMLMSKLVKTGRYLVIDQTAEAVNDIAREKAIAGANAAQSAPLQAQYSIGGGIDEFKWLHDAFTESLLTNYQRHEDDLTAIVRVEFKIVDLSTGQIWRSASEIGKGRGRATSLTLGSSFSSKEFKACPLGAAVRMAVAKAVAAIDAQDAATPWTGRVADVVDNEGNGLEIYLNAGASSGVQVGDEFTISRLNGAARSEIGRVKIVSVDPNVSIARPVSGEGFQASDIATFAGSDSKAQTK